MVLEKTPEGPLNCKEIQPVHPKGDQSLGVHWKDWCWSWNSSTLATSCEELTHWKRHWCWERLKAGGGRDDRGWDGWMASLTRWTWVWVNSGSWWWTGRPGMLRFMGSHGHDWATELNWTEPILYSYSHFFLNILFLLQDTTLHLSTYFLKLLWAMRVTLFFFFFKQSFRFTEKISKNSHIHPFPCIFLQIPHLLQWMN